MTHDAGVLLLIFVTAVLLIGTGIRTLMRHSPLPYTVILLLLGLLLGGLGKPGLEAGGSDAQAQSDMLAQLVALLAHTDPHLILFLFLPTLIFESAFAMETHLFRRIFTQIAILAVPGLIVATLATAALAKGLFPWQWSWPVALMFGALISATDPVAVVALLKEVSSRKRLETLIEGESLLNDGTAIVLFSLFSAIVISSGEWQLTPALLVLDFVWVIAGGALVGGIIGWLAIAWIGKVLNEPLIEITLSISAAYLTFLVAEAGLHVSGVVAVVTLALMFAGLGRTRISAEVSEFLHQFWEMMAHIANTLIFVLVGVIIAYRVDFSSLEAWYLLLLLYVGVSVIRASAIWLFMPLLKRFGIGITREKAIVLGWGGLRGAVALALALSVAQHPAMPVALQNQVLFLAAGIVILTIVINGSSMPWLFRKLKLDQLPPAKQVTVDRAQAVVQQELKSMVPTLQQDHFLQLAHWSEIENLVNLSPPDLSLHARETNASTSSSEKGELIEQRGQVELDEMTAFRRRVLETERRHYWSQFKQGELGEKAAHCLVQAVEVALDGEPEISPRRSLFEYWHPPTWLLRLYRYSWLKSLALPHSMQHLALGYEIARGFIRAQQEVANYAKQLAPSQEGEAAVQAELQKNIDDASRRVQGLKQSFPELIHTLETQLAARLLLVREKFIIRKLQGEAVLDKPEAEKLLNDVDNVLHQLRHLNINNTLYDSRALIADIDWLHGNKAQLIQALADVVEQRIYTKGDVIMRAGERGGSLAIIARGQVVIETEGETPQDQPGQTDRDAGMSGKGSGTVLGALSLLTGVNVDTVVAETPVDMLWLGAEKLKPVLARHPELVRNITRLMQAE